MRQEAAKANRFRVRTANPDVRRAQYMRLDVLVEWKMLEGVATVSGLWL
jgi:hypothetical protein